MEQVSEVKSVYDKTYDDMLEASTAIESAVTFLEILNGQSLSERHRNSAMFGIGMILKAADRILNERMDCIEMEKSANVASGT